MTYWPRNGSKRASGGPFRARFYPGRGAAARGQSGRLTSVHFGPLRSTSVHRSTPYAFGFCAGPLNNTGGSARSCQPTPASRPPDWINKASPPRRREAVWSEACLPRGPLRSRPAHPRGAARRCRAETCPKQADLSRFGPFLGRYHFGPLRTTSATHLVALAVVHPVLLYTVNG